MLKRWHQIEIGNQICLPTMSQFFTPDIQKSYTFPSTVLMDWPLFLFYNSVFYNPQIIALFANFQRPHPLPF